MSKSKLAARYFETLNLLERLHHQMMMLVRDELDRRNEHTLTSTQAMLLYKIGEREVTASQLCEEEECLGANISYSLVKLTDTGYVCRETSHADRRIIRVRLTEKGEAISKTLVMLFDRHLLSLEPVANLGASELGATNKFLKQVQRCRLESSVQPLASAA